MRYFNVINMIHDFAVPGQLRQSLHQLKLDLSLPSFSRCSKTQDARRKRREKDKEEEDKKEKKKFKKFELTHYPC